MESFPLFFSFIIYVSRRADGLKHRSIDSVT